MERHQENRFRGSDFPYPTLTPRPPILRTSELPPPKLTVEEPPKQEICITPPVVDWVEPEVRPSHWNWKWAALLCLAIFAVFLLTAVSASYFIQRSHQETEPPAPPVLVVPDPPVTAAPAPAPTEGPGAVTEPTERTELELSPFQNIEVSVCSGDIRLVEGENYGISYQLPDGGKVRELEVRDGTLYFSTEENNSNIYNIYVSTGVNNAINLSGDVNNITSISGEEWEAVLTIPAGAELGVLRLSTVSGDMELADRTFDLGEFDSTSGDMLMKNLNCEELSISTVSGDMWVLESGVSRLFAESTSGIVEADGTFDTVWMENVSGDCWVNGATAERMEVKTVSGSVEVTGPVGMLMAESNGGVWRNGQAQGRTLYTGEGMPEVKLKSVSGYINVNA